MPDYDLDKLGWYEFERLVQALLKANLSLAIESWGGRGDWGRDAYFEGDLKFPGNVVQSGPFLFQCKFVEEANAAGAKPGPLVLKAVNQEIRKIAERIPGDKSEASTWKGAWGIPPSVYTFITNAPLTSDLRVRIKERFKKVLPNSEIVTWERKDICDNVKISNGIARRFPQILGLQDLDELLRNCVNSDILTRSEAAIQEAKEIASVFSPTSAYGQAQEALHKYNYVVLEGPPEVGKTAIARMMALSFLPTEWEAYECCGPKDILRIYDRQRKQIFIADDSFGRTEYDPSRVIEWQNELPAILRKLGNSHRMILTCRKHLLEMAKARMDIAGNHDTFPIEGEVLVDVSALTDTEKALMLYRHLKRANLEGNTRLVIRFSAEKIVKNTGFTPERIRLLVEEIGKFTERKIDFSKIDNLVSELLRNPTRRMRISYDNLPEAHKWLLISLLSCGGSHFCNEKEGDSLKSEYEQICPVNAFLDYETVVAELSDAFIKRTKESTAGSYTLIKWIHPSYGDMVSKQFSKTPEFREHFLQKCSSKGLDYALSVGGGSQGQTVLPSVRSEEDWSILIERIQAGLSSSHQVLRTLASTLESCLSEPTLQSVAKNLEQLLRESVLPSYIESKNEVGWKLAELRTVAGICEQLHLDPHSIDFTGTWLRFIDSAVEDLKEEEVTFASYEALEQWVTVDELIRDVDPALVETESCSRHRLELFERLQDWGVREPDDGDTWALSPDDASDVACAHENLSKLYKRLAGLSEAGEFEGEFTKVARRFNCLKEEAEEQIPGEPDYERDDYDPGPRSDEPSIEAIFRDL